MCAYVCVRCARNVLEAMGNGVGKEKVSGGGEGERVYTVDGSREAEREREEQQQRDEEDKSMSSSSALAPPGSRASARRKEAALARCSEDQLTLMRCYKEQNLTTRLARMASRVMDARARGDESGGSERDDDGEFSAGCEMERKRFWACFYRERHGGREPPTSDFGALVDAFRPWFDRGGGGGGGGGDGDDGDEKR